MRQTLARSNLTGLLDIDPVFDMVQPEHEDGDGEHRQVLERRLQMRPKAGRKPLVFRYNDKPGELAQWPVVVDPPSHEVLPR